MLARMQPTTSAFVLLLFVFLGPGATPSLMLVVLLHTRIAAHERLRYVWIAHMI